MRRVLLYLVFAVLIVVLVLLLMTRTAAGTIVTGAPVMSAADEPFAESFVPLVAEAPPAEAHTGPVPALVADGPTGEPDADPPVTFIVKSAADEPDADVRDRVCSTASGDCTLRAALQQAHALPAGVAVEIILQVPRIVVTHPDGGFVISRSDLTLRGPTVPAGCGTQLPVHAFGPSGKPGAAIERPATLPPDAAPIGLELLADRITIAGIEVAGFPTGIQVEGRSADLTCLVVHRGETGILINGDGVVHSSAVYDHQEAGIHVHWTGNAAVRSNCIGTLPDCATGAGNRIGVYGPADEVVANVISANETGVLEGMGRGMRIERNRIGTDWTGMRAIGNQVGLSYARNFFNGDDARVIENLVSGNPVVGIRCEGCFLERNRVGVDETGLRPLPNGVGIQLDRGHASGNVVSANTGTGISMSCGGGESLSGNRIGVAADGITPMGNGGHGVHVLRCGFIDIGFLITSNIGGGDPGGGNVIAHNGADGIHFGTEGARLEGPWALRVTNNAIFSNEGLGIGSEPDEGAGSEPPVGHAPSLAQIVVDSDSVHIRAEVRGVPDQPVRVEWFVSSFPDPSGFGEGERPVGSQDGRIGVDGTLSVVHTVSRGVAQPGLWATATVTWHVESLLSGGYEKTSLFSNAVQILAPDVAVPAANPTDVQFGTVAVGASADRILTLRNNGSITLSGGVVPATDFADQGFSFLEDGTAFQVEPGGSVQWTLRFSPPDLGEFSSQLAIQHDGLGSPELLYVPVSGRGASAGAQAAVSTDSLLFGSVVVGTEKSLAFVLRNLGGATLSGTVTGEADFTSNGFLFGRGDGPFSIAGGDSLRVEVLLKPGSVSAKASAVRIDHNAPGSPARVGLSGQGATADAKIAVSPASLNFGSVTIGATAFDTLFIDHTGGSDPLIGSVSDFGDLNAAGFYYASGGGLFSIPPGGRHMVRIAFAPSIVGQRTAQIRVGHNAPNAPRIIPVDLTGSGIQVIPQPIFLLSTPAVDFGPLPIGAEEVAPVPLVNGGAAPLTVTLSLTHGNGSGFSLEDEGVPLAVPADGSLDVMVRFAPETSGTKRDTLRIVHDAPNIPSPAFVFLSAEAVDWTELGPPERMAPADGAEAVPSPVTFRWSALVAAQSYDLEVSETEGFGETTILINTDSTAVMGVELPSFTTHFWRVTARRGEVSSRSDIGSFTTARLNRPPVAVDDTASTTMGQALLVDVLANDFDVDGDTLRIVSVSSPPQHGLAFVSDGRIQYWPNPGFVGEDRFRYTIESEGGLRATATVVVTVLPGTDAESQEALPQVTRLDAPYPNPATGHITIPIALATAGPVRILLYDALGKRVATPVDETFPAGAFQVNLDLGALPAGLYLCVMEAPEGRFVRRFAVVR